MKLQTSFESVSTALEPGTRIVDLFCGIGGFSEGARQAGHKIVLAVDCDTRLLSCHSANHACSECVHMCVELPCGDLPFPSENTFHLHGSPPCTNLSIMQPLQRAEKRAHAVDLVAWFLNLVPKHKPRTWTMEQVNSKNVREQLQMFKRKHRGLCDYIALDMANYGIPQHRRRIIAGTPSLIAKLRRSKCRKQLCVLEAIPRPPMPFIRSALYKRPDEKTRESISVPLKDQIRSVKKPAYTILARGIKRWADSEGNTLRQLSSRESAAIQTFPKNYHLPLSNTVAQLGVGNAIPPEFARGLMSPNKKPLTV